MASSLEHHINCHTIKLLYINAFAQNPSRSILLCYLYKVIVTRDTWRQGTGGGACDTTPLPADKAQISSKTNRFSTLKPLKQSKG